MSYFFRFFFLFFTYSVFGQNSLNTAPAPNQRWVAIGDLDVAGTQITVEALYKRVANGNIQNIVSKHVDPSNVNYLLRPNNFQITTSGGFKVVMSPIPVVNNVWYHVAATYDGSSIKLYINGCLVADSAHTGTIVTNDFVSAIGTRSGSPLTDHYRGLADEVRIWNVARTQSQIANNMNNLANPTTEPGLLVYYKFDGNYTNIQGNATFNGIPQGTPTFDLEAPIIPHTVVDTTIVNAASCFGFSDGAINVNATGNNLTYSIDGTTFTAVDSFPNLTSGQYTIYMLSADGCLDSVLTIVPQPDQVPTPIITFPSPLCETDSLIMSIDSLAGAFCTWFGPNGFITNSLDTIIPNSSAVQSGDYSAFFNLNGCNSDTLIQTITVNPIYDIYIDTAICANQTYSLGSQNLNTAGQYILALQTVAGCDSIIHLTLSINPVYDIFRDTSICEDEIFVYQGQTLNATGTYPFYLQTTLGCDSTITYNLIVYPIPAPPILTSNSPIECPGDLFIFSADSVSGGTYNWTGMNGFSSTSISNSMNAQITDMGFYFVTVMVNGCISPPSELELEILKTKTFDDFDFPNVISANNDNINDSLDLESYFQTCQEFTFFLHDRWGNVVYQFSRGETPFTGVDNKGNVLMDAVYFYALKYEKGTKQGFIHLLR
ncbi:MAG: LamG-like jellyroll fold domain-containing protein [Bacteroidota bacterium]